MTTINGLNRNQMFQTVRAINDAAGGACTPVHVGHSAFGHAVNDAYVRGVATGIMSMVDFQNALALQHGPCAVPQEAPAPAPAKRRKKKKGLKKLGRKIGKGLKKVGKGIGKVVKGVAKGVLSVAKFGLDLALMPLKMTTNIIGGLFGLGQPQPPVG